MRLHRAAGDVIAATSALERLVRHDPYDIDAHQQLLQLLLIQERRADAARRYATLRRRMLSTFGEDLDFALTDVSMSAATG